MTDEQQSQEDEAERRVSEALAEHEASIKEREDNDR